MNKNSSRQIRRFEILNSIITDYFGRFTPEETALFSTYFSQTTQSMIELKSVSRELCHAADLFDDIEYKRIRFIPQIMPYVEAGDVFLVTMGLRDRDWHVFHVSPCYETETIVF